MVDVRAAGWIRLHGDRRPRRPRRTPTAHRMRERLAQVETLVGDTPAGWIAMTSAAPEPCCRRRARRCLRRATSLVPARPRHVRIDVEADRGRLGADRMDA